MKVKIIGFAEKIVVSEISLEDFHKFYGIMYSPWAANKTDTVDYKGLRKGDYAWCLTSREMEARFNRFLISVELNKEVLK